MLGVVVAMETFCGQVGGSHAGMYFTVHTNMHATEAVNPPPQSPLIEHVRTANYCMPL